VLATNTITGDRAVYVFDEVDSGVGGAVAEAIGRKIKDVARHHQVLCITHLPQIAAFADVHFAVTKREEAGRTISAVSRLDEPNRVDEIARMLGGAKITPSTRRAAEEMIEQAHEKPAAATKPVKPKRIPEAVTVPIKTRAAAARAK
jgi:DNA repair protein RecN (Recombination protein N)